MLLDYSHQFPNALVIQGKGSNFLILSRLDHPYVRADGKKASYQIEYRWLSMDCQDENDDNYVCVKGSEYTYWQRKELGKRLLSELNAGNVDLFSRFCLL